MRTRLDTRSDSYAAEVPSLAIKDVQIDDELVLAGVSLEQKDGVNILKGYKVSGKFSRGKESIRAEPGS